MAAALTAGERLVRCLIGEETDRTPYGVGIGWHPWGETIQRWKLESGDENLLPGQELGYDPGFLSPKIEYGCFPHFENDVIEDSSTHVTLRNERGIVCRYAKGREAMPEFIEHPVKTAEDWNRLKAERLQFDEKRLVQVNWDDFRAQLKSSGAAVQVGEYPWGVFGTMRDLMGVEALLMGFYDAPEMIHDMMRHLTSLWLLIWERIAREVQIDHIHIWEDMSGRQGSLISPDMVETFMMPCYDRVADFAQAHNVRLISVDTDGDCSQLVPLMMEYGINVFFPFEVQAGNDIHRYRQLYPELGIIGGLDKRVLADGRAAIDREMERAAQMVKQGRYIPGFDHLIPPDVPWENFCYAATALHAICFAEK